MKQRHVLLWTLALCLTLSACGGKETQEAPAAPETLAQAVLSSQSGGGELAPSPARPCRTTSPPSAAWRSGKLRRSTWAPAWTPGR